MTQRISNEELERAATNWQFARLMEMDLRRHWATELVLDLIDARAELEHEKYFREEADELAIKLRHRIEQLEKALKLAKEALEFYQGFPIVDNGHRAREALAALAQAEEKESQSNQTT